MKIVFTGGGTAGHVTPNIAIIEQLSDCEIHYIGSHDGIEKEMIARLPDVTYHAIRCGKLRRYASMKNLQDIFNVSGGIADAIKIMRSIQPDIVFSKGGFVAVPVVVAASKCHVPVISHESDITPGLANKLTKRMSRYVCLTFRDTLKKIKPPKGIYTGCPIRSELYNGNALRAKEQLGFDDRPVLLVMGGSLGARAINIALRACIDKITDKYNVIHICGKGNLDEILTRKAGYRQFEFVSEQLPDFMALADCVLSRAGANAINEFLALRKPMLLIPLPLSASRGDQILNADSFRRQGFADVLDQENLSPETLPAAIDELFASSDAKKEKMAENSNDDAVKTILSLINKTAKKSS